MNRFRLWRWLSTPDPSPGLTPRKLGKLALKSMLFAFLAVALQLLLRALGLSFVNTTWGSLLVVLLVYIPFARLLSVDFAPPPRAARPGGKEASVKRARKRKYAGVKKGGPRF